ncbi:hypothetical protein CFO_g3891 [Ceratocystis platani]|uniref:Efficient mitochondria targeting-associated protein 19 n=1 Tax=Ceratocystis fimbriata f. sp. platani TaxID=88771 RepID=A0A0F8CSN3_CERFI|nr:hypothetical protein CFO_g3891 [Ceratocystis platani]
MHSFSHTVAQPLVDLVPFYPAWLWATPDAPLSFLNAIRQFYITTYNDPYFTQPHPSWFDLFTYIEVVYQFPAAAYLLFKFMTERQTSGVTELHALIFSLGFALTTLTCVWDVPYWDSTVYTTAQKVEFMTVIYGPFFLIPGIMAVDMFARLHKRLSPDVSDSKKRL